MRTTQLRSMLTPTVTWSGTAEDGLWKFASQLLPPRTLWGKQHLSLKMLPKLLHWKSLGPF